MSALPLSGIKVLDLTRVLAGPLSAQMLGDLGADVIKIERPNTGDDARAFGPPYLSDPQGRESNNNSFYICANRNKRSITVNIARPDGQTIIRELAKDCDVSWRTTRLATSSDTDWTTRPSGRSTPESYIAQ